MSYISLHTHHYIRLIYREIGGGNVRFIKLNSGDQIPVIGLGTWQITGKTCTNAVRNALELGYRHIDTADVYGNHQDIAPALKDTSLSRSELFITSKIHRNDLRFNDVIKTVERLLKELGLEYLDLLLIHWPNKNIPISETLEAFSKLKEEKKVRNFGVSNFTISHLCEALRYNSGLISLNQVEFHPYLYQKGLLKYCMEKNIVLTAYSPLGRGEIFNDNRVTDLADKYNVSPGQLVLRWIVDKGIVVIPKASSIEHIKDNMDIFGWELPAEVNELLDNLNREERFVCPLFNEF